MRYTLIEDQTTLQGWLAAIDTDQLLAVDTEFFRETTYFPKLGLVQLASGGDIALVDPLAFDASAPLAEVLLSPDIRKLFHSCSQDLEVLHHHLGGLPCPLYDTQVAAALVIERDQISYADIVARNCGVELAKSQTRTNWLKRPLSREQLKYAAEDVHYLVDVHEILMDELDTVGRMTWFEEDCARICAAQNAFEPDIDRCWSRVKGTHRMQPEQLAIVDAMARWREHAAIRLDVTRRKVISDDAIIAAALDTPRDTRSLTSTGKWHRSLRQEELRSLLVAIDEALSAPEHTWPRHSRYLQTPEQKDLIKRMMQLIENCASELGIAQSVLASRKELESMIEGNRELNILYGWRREIIGDQVLALLER